MDKIVETFKAKNGEVNVVEYKFENGITRYSVRGTYEHWGMVKQADTLAEACNQAKAMVEQIDNDIKSREEKLKKNKK